MKKLKTAFISLLCLSCMTISNKGSASNPVLRISDGWVADTIAPALIHYRFAGYDSISQAHQNVDVLEVDLTSPSYDIQLVYEEHGDSLSSVAERNNAAAAINGTYEAEASFIKIGGRLLAQNRLDSTHTFDTGNTKVPSCSMTTTRTSTSDLPATRLFFHTPQQTFYPVLPC